MGNRLRDALVIGTDHGTHVLRVELGGERCRADEVPRRPHAVVGSSGPGLLDLSKFDPETHKAGTTVIELAERS
jgi:hypothetical protein